MGVGHLAVGFDRRDQKIETALLQTARTKELAQLLRNVGKAHPITILQHLFQGRELRGGLAEHKSLANGLAIFSPTLEIEGNGVGGLCLTAGVFDVHIEQKLAATIEAAIEIFLRLRDGIGTGQTPTLEICIGGGKLLAVRWMQAVPRVENFLIIALLKYLLRFYLRIPLGVDFRHEARV